MPDEIAWGTDVVRRDGPLPFLVYQPRRHRITDLLDDCARWAGRDHLVRGTRRVTFGQLAAAADRVAARLAALGLRPGDRLLLLAANSPDWVIALWAGLRLRAVVALGNRWWSAEEVTHAITLISPTLIVTDPHLTDSLPPGSPPTVLTPDIESWSAAPNPTPLPPTPLPPTPLPPTPLPPTPLPPTPPAAPIPPASSDVAATATPSESSGEEDPALIIFTAGTTGLPKAAVLAHRSVIANLHSLLLVTGRLPHQVDPGGPAEVMLLSGPLFHVGGVQALLVSLLGGNTVVFLEGRFDAGQVLDLIERERVTIWGAVPTMVTRVLEHPSRPGRDLSTVRSISLGGSPVPSEVAARVRSVFPSVRRGVATLYGMTEAGGTVAAAPGALMTEHPRTSGRPMPVAELRIDPATGEILVRTPSQMLGYWGEGVPSVIDADGWLHTGDLGRISDGLLYVTGRAKDVIIRGGENIAAAHVEEVLHRHPAVAAVAVVGLPDPDFGEVVGAVIQPRAPVTQAELTEFALAHLARFEVPTHWWLHPAPLPASEVGKTDKRALRTAWLTRLPNANVPPPSPASPSPTTPPP